MLSKAISTVQPMMQSESRINFLTWHRLYVDVSFANQFRKTPIEQVPRQEAGSREINNGSRLPLSASGILQRHTIVTCRMRTRSIIDDGADNKSLLVGFNAERDKFDCNAKHTYLSVIVNQLDQKSRTLRERFPIFQVVLTWRPMPSLAVATTITNLNIVARIDGDPA